MAFINPSQHSPLSFVVKTNQSALPFKDIKPQREPRDAEMGRLKGVKVWGWKGEQVF